MLPPLWRGYDEPRGILKEKHMKLMHRDTRRGEPEASLRQSLNPAAERALSEAQERRRLAAEARNNRPLEIGGRKGPDPVRYGDWEVKGIASDF
jgi:hypothetical protein